MHLLFFYRGHKQRKNQYNIGFFHEKYFFMSSSAAYQLANFLITFMAYKNILHHALSSYKSMEFNVN